MEEQYADLAIPEFLQRPLNETLEQHRELWNKYQPIAQRKRNEAMEIAKNKLAEMIKSDKIVDECSISEIVLAYNAAMVQLERPGDQIGSFRDKDTAIKRMKGVLVTLRAPAPKPDPNLKPVAEKATGKGAAEKGKAAGTGKDTGEAKGSSGKPGKAPGKDVEKAVSGKPEKQAKEPRKGRVSKKSGGGSEKPPVHHRNVGVPALKEAFGTREGSNREKLLEALGAKQGHQVPILDLIKAVYGSKQEAHKGKLLMVMKGLYVMIEDGHLPFAVHKMDDPKTQEMTFGLYSLSK